MLGEWRKAKDLVQLCELQDSSRSELQATEVDDQMQLHEQRKY